MLGLNIEEDLKRMQNDIGRFGTAVGFLRYCSANVIGHRAVLMQAGMQMPKRTNLLTARFP